MPMYGCPRSRKIFFERLGRMIGGGHVSGLEMRPVTTAGRYGDARTCCKSLERAEGSVGVLLFQIRIMEHQEDVAVLSNHSTDAASVLGFSVSKIFSPFTEMPAI